MVFFYFDTFIYCSMIATVSIISNFITLHNYHLFLVAGIIKFWSLSKFDDYNTILLPMFTRVSMSSLGCTCHWVHVCTIKQHQS